MIAACCICVVLLVLCVRLVCSVSDRGKLIQENADSRRNDVVMTICRRLLEL